MVRSFRLKLRHDPVTVTPMHPPLTATRLARTIGSPESWLAEPATVGRRLANKIERTDATFYAV